MSDRLEAIISDILLREGGYVDHPADKGGPTKFGITQATLSDWRHRQVTPEEVRLMDEDEARDIYRARYIIDPGFGGLPDALRDLVVDCAVNHGPTRAVAWLREAAGLSTIGKMGPEVDMALQDLGAPRVYRKLLGKRVRFYGRIITDNPKQAAFAAGWANRVASFVEMTP
ncbi:MAG: glycoside hydrolase family 108 protein [Candidatus Eiseniibacteriota bacterium]